MKEGVTNGNGKLTRAEARFQYLIEASKEQDNLEIIEKMYEYLTDDANTESQQAKRCLELVDYDYCYRWLRQKKWDFQVGLEACSRHLKFQQDFAIHGRIQKSEVQDSIADKKVFLPCVTAKGEPVVLLKASRHFIGKSDETNKMISYVLDASVKAANLSPTSRGKISCVIDLTGLGMRNLDVTALQQIFVMLQQHYPERLGQGIWFINAPWIFYNIWPMVSPLLAETTRSRLNFVNDDPDNEILAELLGSKDLVPSLLGGPAKDSPIDEVADMCDAWLAVEDTIDSMPNLNELLQNTDMRPPEPAPPVEAA